MSFRRRFGALALAAVLLAGCGQAAGPASSSAGSSAAGAPASSPAASGAAKPVGSAAASAANAPSGAAGASAKPAAAAGPSGSAAAVAPASSAAAKPAGSAASAGTVVHIATVGSISDAGFYIADDRGYFKEQGLSADFQRLQSGPQMVPLLATGQLDVAGGSVSGALFSAVQRDIPLRIVADKGTNQPGFTFSYIAVRKDLVDSGQFKTWADLKGKKVAISSTDNSAEYFVDKVLRDNKLSIKDVDATILGYPDMGAGFANKGIDAAQVIEPFATQFVGNGVAVIPDDKEKVYPGFQAAVLMYGPKFVQNNPDVGRKVMVAYIKGVRDYTRAFTKGTDKEAIIQSLISHSTVKDRALYDKMGMPGLNPDGAPNDKEVAAQQDFFLAQGYQKQKLDLTPVLDHSFVDYAISQLGKYSG